MMIGFRTGFVCLFVAMMLGCLSCSGPGNCVEVGDDLFANLEKVSSLAAELGLPTEQNEAAVIVGAARAVSDLGGERVSVCLRLGDGNETEFRILSMERDHLRNGLDQWMPISALMQGAGDR